MMQLLLALLLALQPPMPAQAIGFRIAGQVVGPTGTPIRGARVSIFPTQHPDKRSSVVTGEAGSFSFTGIPAGKYSLQVQDHGRVRLYQQCEEYSTAIATGPGLDSEHIRFELQPDGQISGSARDDAGDPVQNATVYLFASWIYRGSRVTGLRQTKTTANDGSFRFTRLEPGVYYIGVAGRPWYLQPGPVLSQNGMDVRPAPELDVAYPFMYYSGAIDPSAATPILVEPGSRADITFLLRPVSSLHITLDGFVNTPERRVSAAWRMAGPGGTIVDVPVAGGTENGVTICPGTYRISADEWARNQMSTLGSQDLTLSSDMTVRVADSVKTSVTGKVLLSDTERPQGLVVLLEGASNTNHARGWIQKDGAFDMGEVPPGRYNLRLANTAQLYMKSVAVKGGKYLKGVLEVEHEAHVELTIAVSAGMQTIDGIAMRNGNPIAGAMVLAVPQDFSHGNYIPRDQSDSDGTFSLAFAPPGRYIVIAVDNGRDLEYALPLAVEPYLKVGTPVNVPLAAYANALQVEVQARR